MALKEQKCIKIKRLRTLNGIVFALLFLVITVAVSRNANAAAAHPNQVYEHSDQEKIQTVFQRMEEAENFLPQSLVQPRLAQLFKAVPTSFDSLWLLADNEAQRSSFGLALRNPADPDPFWQILSKWISTDLFSVETFIPVLQLAKTYADTLPVTFRGPGSSKTERLFLMTYLSNEQQKEIKLQPRKIAAAIIDALPVLLKLAVKNPPAFNAIIASVKMHSRGTDWRVTHFFRSYFAFLTVIFEAQKINDIDALNKAIETISVGFEQAEQRDDLSAFTKAFQEEAQGLKSRRVGLCKESTSSMSLFGD